MSNQKCKCGGTVEVLIDADPALHKVHHAIAKCDVCGDSSAVCIGRDMALENFEYKQNNEFAEEKTPPYQTPTYI